MGDVLPQSHWASYALGLARATNAASVIREETFGSAPLPEGPITAVQRPLSMATSTQSSSGTVTRPGSAGLGRFGGTAVVPQRPESQILGVLVADDELTSDWVAEHIPAMLADPQRLAAMSAAAGATGHRDAADAVARAALELAR